MKIKENNQLYIFSQQFQNFVLSGTQQYLAQNDVMILICIALPFKVKQDAL